MSYTLTPVVHGPGRIILSPQQGAYAPGIQVKVTAVPDAGSEFQGWGWALGGEANPAYIWMNESKEIHATFSAISVTLPPPTEGDPDVFTEVYKGVWIWQDKYSGQYHFHITESGAEQWAATLLEARGMIDSIVGVVDSYVETYRGVEIWLHHADGTYWFTWLGVKYSYPYIGNAEQAIDALDMGEAPPPVTPPITPPTTPPTTPPVKGSAILDRFVGFNEMPVFQRIVVGAGVLGLMAGLMRACFPRKKIRDLADEG